MDMAGNVWEWMENWYDKDKDTRSLRGGSWVDIEYVLRCSERLRFRPGYHKLVRLWFSRCSFPAMTKKTCYSDIQSI